MQKPRWADTKPLLRISDEAIRLKPDDAEVYNNRGRTQKAKLDLPEDAIVDYDKAISLKPDYDEAFYNRGVMKAGLGLPKDAIADYDKAIQPEAGLRRSLPQSRCRQLALNGEHEAAIKEYTKAIQSRSDYTFAYYNRGLAYLVLGQTEAARRDIEKAALKLGARG